MSDFRIMPDGKLYPANALPVKELQKAGGAVMSSQWVFGKGKDAKRKPVPVCCERASLKEALATCERGAALTTLRRIFVMHPRCRSVVYLAAAQEFDMLDPYLGLSAADHDNLVRGVMVEVNGIMRESPVAGEMFVGGNALGRFREHYRQTIRRDIERDNVISFSIAVPGSARRVFLPARLAAPCGINLP